MSEPPEKSNIAIRFDDASETFTTSSQEVLAILSSIRQKLHAGDYRPHQVEPVEELLRRSESDPHFFLNRVRGAGGASMETVATDRGSHGMDGSRLPQDDARKLASALTARNRARADMEAAWPKMSASEQATRQRSSAGPTS